jgi:hypothetical protein
LPIDALATQWLLEECQSDCKIHAYHLDLSTPTAVW